MSGGTIPEVPDGKLFSLLRLHIFYCFFVFALILAFIHFHIDFQSVNIHFVKILFNSPFLDKNAWMRLAALSLKCIHPEIYAASVSFIGKTIDKIGRISHTLF